MRRKVYLECIIGMVRWFKGGKVYLGSAVWMGDSPLCELAQGGKAQDIVEEGKYQDGCNQEENA